MDIFIINTDKLNEIPENMLAQHTYKEFKNEHKKEVHQFAYLMLDRILKDFYKIENQSISHNNGKPELLSKEKNISISHSGTYIALAFSDSMCGIDIEQIRPRNYEKISKRMGFNSKSLKDFYINWTKYEAEYKLNNQSESIYTFEIPNYIVTAISINKNEPFEVYYGL